MIEKLIKHNKHWAAMHELEDGTYFERLSEGQAPEYLWIGCADSRVPAETLLGLKPGQLFVHRNIANQVKVDDSNSMSVLQFAVEVLKVRHIIICGHSGCGGVKTAFDGAGDRYLESWLQELKDLKQEKLTELDSKLSDDEKLSLFTELNVKQQVDNVVNHDIVKNAWLSGQELAVHGWVFELDSGLINDLGVTQKA